MGNDRTINSPVRENDVVYAIKRMSDGCIKIGTTQDLRARLITFKGDHGDVVLLGVQKGYRLLESQLHQTFEQYRVRIPRHTSGNYYTEWFYPAPEIYQYIAEYMTLDNVNTREICLRLEWGTFGKLAEIAYSNGVTVEEMTATILQFYAENIEPVQLPLDLPPAAHSETEIA